MIQAISLATIRVPLTDSHDVRQLVLMAVLGAAHHPRTWFSNLFWLPGYCYIWCPGENLTRWPATFREFDAVASGEKEWMETWWQLEWRRSFKSSSSSHLTTTASFLMIWNTIPRPLKIILHRGLGRSFFRLSLVPIGENIQHFCRAACYNGSLRMVN